MRRYAAEALGTFALVFAGTGAVITDELTGGAVGLVGVAMTFGLIVMAMIYAIGDLSGAHINPVVSLGAWVAGRFDAKQVPPYVVAQCLGAVAASISLRTLYPEATTLGETLPQGAAFRSLALEVMLTFLLVFVIFNATAPGKPEASLAGLVIGGTVALEVFVGGPISGASMNPARSIGPALVAGKLEYLWIYVVGPGVGAVLAAGVTRVLRSADGQPDA